MRQQLAWALADAMSTQGARSGNASSPSLARRCSCPACAAQFSVWAEPRKDAVALYPEGGCRTSWWVMPDPPPPKRRQGRCVAHTHKRPALPLETPSQPHHSCRKQGLRMSWSRPRTCSPFRESARRGPKQQQQAPGSRCTVTSPNPRSHTKAQPTGWLGGCGHSAAHVLPAVHVMGAMSWEPRRQGITHTPRPPEHAHTGQLGAARRQCRRVALASMEHHLPRARHAASPLLLPPNLAPSLRQGLLSAPPLLARGRVRGVASTPHRPARVSGQRLSGHSAASGPSPPKPARMCWEQRCPAGKKRRPYSLNCRRP